MSDVNNEMKITADYAIKAAKERFGQELDFSEESIDKFENLLERAYQSLSNRIKDEKAITAISRTANIWGSYLGEFIRLKWGGTWKLKGSEQVIYIKNIEFSPIGFVNQKITSHPEYNIKIFLAEVERKILPQVTNEQDVQVSSESVVETNPPKKYKGIKSIILLIAIITISWILIRPGVFTIQPIGALPEGITFLYHSRGPEMPFFSSPDSLCLKTQGSVSLLCRLAALSVASQLTDRIVLRLPYSHWAYLQSTNGLEFDR